MLKKLLLPSLLALFSSPAIAEVAISKVSGYCRGPTIFCWCPTRSDYEFRFKLQKICGQDKKAIILKIDTDKSFSDDGDKIYCDAKIDFTCSE